MKCHCGGELIAHEGGIKDGTFHCNACGCCMTPDGENRANHPGCGQTGIVKEAPLKPRATKAAD